MRALARKPTREVVSMKQAAEAGLQDRQHPDLMQQSDLYPAQLQLCQLHFGMALTTPVNAKRLHSSDRRSTSLQGSPLKKSDTTLFTRSYLLHLGNQSLQLRDYPLLRALIGEGCTHSRPKSHLNSRRLPPLLAALDCLRDEKINLERTQATSLPPSSDNRNICKYCNNCGSENRNTAAYDWRNPSVCICKACQAACKTFVSSDGRHCHYGFGYQRHCSPHLAVCPMVEDRQ